MHLGTLVVDNSSVWEGADKEGEETLTSRAQPPKITLKLPVEEEEKKGNGPPNKRAKLNTEGIPDEYEVVMPSERVKNTYIFSEAERVWVAKPGESSGPSQRRKHQKGECGRAADTSEGSLEVATSKLTPSQASIDWSIGPRSQRPTSQERKVSQDLRAATVGERELEAAHRPARRQEHVPGQAQPARIRFLQRVLQARQGHGRESQLYCVYIS